MPSIVTHYHLYQNISGKESFIYFSFLTFRYYYLLLRRNHNIKYSVCEAQRLGSLLKCYSDLIFMSGICMNYKPLSIFCKFFGDYIYSWVKLFIFILCHIICLKLLLALL